MKRILLFTIVFFSTVARSQNLVVQSGASFIATGTPTIVLNNMGLDAALNTTDLQAANLTVSGNANCLLKNSSAFINLQKLTVDKPGAALSIANNVQVYNSVQMVNGLFDLTDRQLFLASTSTISGETETARITASAGGFIEKVLNLGFSNNFNAGGMGVYITTAANTGLVAVRRGHKVQTGTGISSGINRYFELVPAVNTALNATLKFTYFDAELNGQPEAGLQLLESTNGGAAWINKTVATKDAAANYITINGINSLYRYTLGSAARAPLPVSLFGFAAQCKETFVQLTWNTAAELNSDRFDVQRSGDGSAWEKIGSVKAAGNSVLMQSYQYNDNGLRAASAFYRLAQYDKDGKFTYSSIVKAGCGTSTEFKVMPNPVTTQAKVVMGSRSNSAGTLQLFNAAGQQVYQQDIRLSAGMNQTEINASGLPAGTYTLRLTQEGAAAQTISLVKQ